MESCASSSRASTASRALRLRERSRERKRPRELLGDRARPLGRPPRAQIARKRTGDGYRIDAVMAEKAVVLDGHDRRAQRRGNALERDLPAPRVEREPRCAVRVEEDRIRRTRGEAANGNPMGVDPPPAEHRRRDDRDEAHGKQYATPPRRSASRTSPFCCPCLSIVRSLSRVRTAPRAGAFTARLRRHDPPERTPGIMLEKDVQAQVDLDKKGAQQQQTQRKMGSPPGRLSAANSF